MKQVNCTIPSHQRKKEVGKHQSSLPTSLCFMAESSYVCSIASLRPLSHRAHTQVIALQTFVVLAVFLLNSLSCRRLPWLSDEVSRSLCRLMTRVHYAILSGRESRRASVRRNNVESLCLEIEGRYRKPLLPTSRLIYTLYKSFHGERFPL